MAVYIIHLFAKNIKGSIKGHGFAGNGCEKRHYQCGDDARTCIGDILVCDGSPDCPNGSDEDEDTCRKFPLNYLWLSNKSE